MTDIDLMGLAPSVLRPVRPVVPGVLGVLGVRGVTGVPGVASPPSPRLPGPITFLGTNLGVGGSRAGPITAAF